MSRSWSESWDDLPVYDLSALVAEYRDDPEILSEVLGIFLQEAPQRVEAIRAGLDAGDSTRVQKAAHSLANTTGTLGAERALRLARATEESARAEDLEEMSRRGRLLLVEVEEILRQIRVHQSSSDT
ncbi:MAG: hypothetical protein GVY29_03275 [Spirochaetes bacterium]|jgi:HPt (histidine-containing phosphotransfer) domain-containing protein|nr:hypothetical protein [Spirochaetota bacterium]